jgi:hypothetical protein
MGPRNRTEPNARGVLMKQTIQSPVMVAVLLGVALFLVLVYLRGVRPAFIDTQAAAPTLQSASPSGSPSSRDRSVD